MNITQENVGDNASLTFWRLGYRMLLPIVPPTAEISERSTLHAHIGTPSDPRGKAPGVRGWSGQWYGFDWLKHQTTEDDLRRWAVMHAGVGLRLGPHPAVGATNVADASENLFALDVDTLDPTLAEIAWRTLQRVVPAPNARRIGRAPKFLVLLRSADVIKYTRVEFTGHEGKRERVELLGAGRQCVVHGVHPITGKPYTWDPAPPALLEVAIVSAEQVSALFDRLRAVLPDCSAPQHEGSDGDRAADQSMLRGDLETVRKAVEALPNTTALYPSRESYLKVGYAIKAALPDDGDAARELFLDWCSRWHDDPKGEGNDLERAVSDWQRMKPPYGVGAGWLYEQADQHGGGDFREADRWFSAIASAKEGELVFGLDTESVAGNPASGNIAADAAPTPLVWIDPAAWRDPPKPREWEVEGLIPRGEVTLLYGEGGVGKTLLMQQYATAAANGKDWLGLPTRPSRVLALLCEDGPDELHRRQIDIERALDVVHSGPSAFHFASGQFAMNELLIFGANGQGRLTPRYVQLVQSVREFRADVLIVDTIADTFGGNEIDRRQVNAFLKFCLGGIIRETGCTVIALGHPSQAGRSSGDGTSGSTAWNNAVRSRLYMRRVDNQPTNSPLRIIEAKKANYGPVGAELMVEWRAGAYRKLRAANVRSTDGVGAMSVEDEVEQAVLACVAANGNTQMRIDVGATSRYRASAVLPQIEPQRFAGMKTAQIDDALRRLSAKGAIAEIEIGKNGSRHPVFGLCIVSQPDCMSHGVFG